MKHILVVDDEAMIRSLLVEELEDLGYRCTQAENGARAMERVQEEMPDLVVTDGAMPIMDGPAFIAEFREKYGDSSAPVIVVSALSTEVDIERAKSAGADDYARKPIDFDELGEQIEKLLARPAP